MKFLRTTAIFLIALCLIVMLVPASALAQSDGSPEKKEMSQSVEKTSDGGYHIQLGELHTYYYGYRFQFHGENTEDYDKFQMNMNTLRVTGDLEGNGLNSYHCHLNQISWQYRTGESYGLLEGYADIDLERSEGPDNGGQTRNGGVEGHMGSRQAPPNDDVPGGPADEGQPPSTDDGQDPPADEGNNGPEDPAKPLLLQSWAQIMVRFQGADENGGLKFDIRLRLREPARGEITMKLEQNMEGQKHTFKHRHMVQAGSGDAQGEQKGEYQLQDQNKMVARYSWKYQYNTSNANGSEVQERTMGEEVTEGEQVSFVYQLKAGEQDIVHDPSVYVDESNINSILDKTGDLLKEHRMSILAGLLIGLILIVVITVAVLKARGNGGDVDDDKFDLRKNRYYKK